MPQNSIFPEPKKAKTLGSTRTKYQAVTKNGHNTDEVASAMQKAVRRGEEEEVIYWVSELYDIGWWRYILKRMAVIASEDIGLANNEAIQFVNSIWQVCLLENGKDNRRPDSLHFWHLALYMARSPKSRMVDYAGGWIIEAKEKEDMKIPVPDYAVDQHTARGKEKGMGDKQFLEEGARIMNKKRLDNEDFYRKEHNRLYGFGDIKRNEDEF